MVKQHQQIDEMVVNRTIEEFDMTFEGPGVIE